MWSRLKEFIAKVNRTLTPENKPVPAISEEKLEKPTMRTCIHEAGHYMIARMFPEKIRINELNANKSDLVGDMNGALNITDVGFATLNSYDHIMLTAAGGLVANTISLRGKDYVTQNLSRFPFNLEGLDLFGTGGDYELIQEFASKIAVFWKYTQNGYVKVQWNAIQFVFCYLLEEVVWDTLLILSQGLYDSEHYKLSAQEAEVIVCSSPYFAELEKTEKEYFSDRYPLGRLKSIKLI